MQGLYLRILSCRVTDHVRKACRNKIDLVEALPEPAKMAAHEAELRDDQRHEETLFSRVLTEREYQVVTLKFREGLSTSQIAKRLGIPEGTVCFDLFNTRRKLRDHLGDV